MLENLCKHNLKVTILAVYNKKLLTVLRFKYHFPSLLCLVINPLLHNAAFHLGLHYLLRQNRSSEKEI